MTFDTSSPFAGTGLRFKENVVFHVTAGTQAASKGVRPGWVVCRLNGKDVILGDDIPNLRSFAGSPLVIHFKAPSSPLLQNSARAKDDEGTAERDLCNLGLNPLRLRQRR